MKKKIKCKGYLLLTGLIVLSFVPLFDLFHPGLPITHDGQDHVARIANFYQNLTEGNIIPRWAGNLNWGYGHPILEFLYPLPSYLASLFHFVGFSLVDSVKLVFGISFVLSGMAMYIFIKELLRNEKAAFFAGLLYVIAPYRFVDLYVRGAIGEHVAFIFPPLVFYFLLKLSRKVNFAYVVGGSFSMALLILSHNAITLMFLPIIFLYILYLLSQSTSKKYFILNTCWLILLGFALSSFFWLSAFFEGKYTLRDIVTGGGEYAKSFVMWKDFFISAWSYGGTITLSKQIGFIQWVGGFGSVVAAYHLYKKRNKLWIICLGCFFIFLTTLFLMTPASNPIWQMSTMLQKFQFPWRFLSVTVFTSALLGALVLHTFSDRYRKILLLILVVSLFFANRNYWHAQGYLQKPESFFTAIYYGTTDTGESAPIWSVRFMEKPAKANIEVIMGNAKIQELNRTSTIHGYGITVVEESRIRENTLYFPGWEVFVDGKKTDVEFQDPQNRGLMTFIIEKGKHTIDVRFKETKLRLFSNVLSLFSILVIVAFILKSSFYDKKISTK